MFIKLRGASCIKLHQKLYQQRNLLEPRRGSRSTSQTIQQRDETTAPKLRASPTVEYPTLHLRSGIRSTRPFTARARLQTAPQTPQGELQFGKLSFACSQLTVGTLVCALALRYCSDTVRCATRRSNQTNTSHSAWLLSNAYFVTRVSERMLLVSVWQWL